MCAVLDSSLVETLRVPLNPEFCREVAEFLGFFLADFGGSVRNRRKMVKKVGKRFCMGLEVRKK
jgi:hypothetical protein